MTLNPYDIEGFHARAIAAGRHRDIVGGRWDETGRIQMQILQAAGLKPQHRLLDIGAGALRLGCKAVPYLAAGHYWATDASRELMLTGRALELTDPDRLPEAHLIRDAVFSFDGVDRTITHAIAFAVFPHLPQTHLKQALKNLQRFEHLEVFLFTVFLAPNAKAAASALRQPDGVVTHAQRAPYHLLAENVAQMAAETGWRLERSEVVLPRGQVLFRARPGIEPSA